MYLVTHATIAVAAAKAGEPLFPRRWLPLDYRFAAVGALLPDVIDKPLGWFLIPSASDDHLWGHTLLFSGSMILLGALVGALRGDARVLLLGLGALTHILVDPTNAHPRTLFWPLLGTTFPDVRGYLFVLPITLEIALIGSIAYSARRSAIFRERLLGFIRNGTVPALTAEVDD